MKWIGLGLALVLVVALAFVGQAMYPYYRLYRLKDAPAMGHMKAQKVSFFIPTGAKLKEVSAKLKQKGWLLSLKDFVLFAEAKNYRGSRIVPGKYVLEREWTYNQLVNHLRAGRGRRSVKVSFHYIKDWAALAQKVASQIEPHAKALLAAFQDTKIQRQYGFTSRDFQMMFLSDTYRLNWACSAACFVKQMNKAYKRFWRGPRRQKAKALGLSRWQVYTLASIVQAEQSRLVDEWPMIAGLYINRLKRDMKLEADPTVKFALGKPGLRRILFKHLKVDSPYNTYQHKGLPPGPINWPEKRAILAVLNHKKHDYIYMCAKPTFSGRHNFAKTTRQHKRNAKLYHRWLTKQGIR